MDVPAPNPASTSDRAAPHEKALNHATIHLLRHGRIPQAAPRRFIGQRDLPLDDTGREQARVVGLRLKEIPFTRVVCSDLARTHETARLVTQGRGLEIETEPRLREIHLGQWEGLTTQEVKAAFPGEYEARGKNLARVRPAGGESFLDLQRRVAPCFEKIAQNASGHVLVVAHAGVNRAILCHLLGMDLADIFKLGQDYCCLNRITSSEGHRCLEVMNLTLWREQP